MSIIIFAIIVLIVASLAIYACDLVPMTPPFNNLIKLLVILLAIVIICDRAGLL